MITYFILRVNRTYFSNSQGDITGDEATYLADGTLARLLKVLTNRHPQGDLEVNPHFPNLNWSKMNPQLCSTLLELFKYPALTDLRISNLENIPCHFFHGSMRALKLENHTTYITIHFPSCPQPSTCELPP